MRIWRRVSTMGLEADAKRWMEKKKMSGITATEYQIRAAETAIFPSLIHFGKQVGINH